MKKILALALALIMVLALVPTSFAATTTYVNADSYTLTAELKYKDGGSIESKPGTDGKFTAKGRAPALTINDSFDSIVKADPDDGNLWDDTSLNIKLTLTTLSTQFEAAAANELSVKINGKDQTDNVTFADVNKELSFKMLLDNPKYTTYDYAVVVTWTKGNGDKVIESINFSVTFKDNAKSKYDLKFIDADKADLSDGIWYVDSASPNLADVPEIKFTVTRNDGTKFTKTAYYDYNVTEEKYLTAVRGFKVNTDKSTILLEPLKYGLDEANKTYNIYVTVEDQGGIYRGILKLKYRTNVWRADPKGVYFAQREYTIGVNEVLTPTYTTIVPVYHKIADKKYMTLKHTANSDKGIFDIDDGKIIGKAEGTAYVYLVYEDFDWNGAGLVCTYTDTVKIIVKGKYQVVPDANYVVTASSLNVRSGAGTSYKSVGSLKKGAVVKVVEIKDGWAKIVTDKFTNQYVSAQYLQLQASGGSTPSTGTKTVIARVLNVRSGAGTGFAIVGKLNRGATVTVEEIVANGNWAKITFQGKTAYVHTAYLK